MASLHGRMAPEAFAEALYALGVLYSCRVSLAEQGRREAALIGVERNHSSGHTVLRRLRERGYPHLYWHRRINVRTERPRPSWGG